MKRKKRFVAMLLSLLMVFSLCTNATYAEDDTDNADSTVVETVDVNSDDEAADAINDSTNVVASEETDVNVDETTETDVVTSTSDDDSADTDETTATVSAAATAANSLTATNDSSDSDEGIATIADDEGDYIARGICGDNLTWTLDSDYNLVISGTGAMYSYSSAGSNQPWYSYLNQISSVTISDGVTSIGTSAFYDCANLQNINLANSITSIGDMAFQNCSSLVTIIIPDSITSIGLQAFYKCTSLTTVNLSNNLISIGNFAFQQCSSLSSISLPDKLESIGEGAFEECTNLLNVVLPENITEISPKLFYGCTSLETVTAKGTLISIGNEAFRSCSSLISLINDTDEDSITTIGYFAFRECDKLTTIPGLSKVTTMNIYSSSWGSSAFYNCTSLSDTIDLSSLDEIPDYTFYKCKNIEGVIFSERLTSIGNRAFYMCNHIRELDFPDTLTSIGDYAFWNCWLNGNKSIETIVEKGSLVYDAFEYKETLSESKTYTGYTVKIPASVTYVGKNAFLYSYVEIFDIGCSLTEIDCSAFATYSLAALIFDNIETAINYSNMDKLSDYSDLDLVYRQSNAPIYLDGINGNDDNYGTSIEAAVKTFDKALSLAEEYGTTNIYVIGTITISDDQKWDGTITIDGEETVVNLIRYKELKDASLIELNDGGNLTLSNIIVDGKKISSTASLIRVNNSDSVLIINDGTIIRNNLNTSNDLTANPNNGAICVLSGKLIMNGGEVTGNSGNFGGGIALTTLSNTTANMEMNAGTISNNNADIGGGIYMYGNATLEMNGNPGGTITKNIASTFGGGIYIGSGSVANIYSGYITYNTSKTSTGFGGGGIYVNSAQQDYETGKLYVYNVEIAYNKVSSTAADSKGYSSTIASCETGSIEINITDGAVIHDNETTKTIQIYQDSSAATFILSPIMLGGGLYNWTNSQGIAYELDQLTISSSEARWINFVTSVTKSDCTGLNRVKTYITGNDAVFVGAAIGSNGEVYIGKSDGDVTLDINKVWDDSVKEKAESIEVEVYAISDNDGKTNIGTVTLSDKNEWKVSISNLPKYDTEGNEYVYEVEEVGNDYFNEIETTVKSSGSVYDEDEDKTASYSFTITNKELSILTLEKNVVGTTINDKFVFEVTLKSGNDLYTGSVKAILNDTDETLIEFVDGIGNVELGADDSIDLYLEKGMTYTIEETDNKGALDTTVKINNVSQNNTSVSETINEDTIVSYTNNYETTELLVSKVWSDANDQDGIRPDEITVVLVKNGEATDQTVTLNADNNWSTSFMNLPKYSNGEEIKYTVEEVSVEGYTSVVTGNMSEGFVITNTHTPTTPTDPTTPDDSTPTTPSEPEESTPSETTTPTTSTETTPSTSTTETSTNDVTTEAVETNVKTGDETQVIGLCLLGGLALICAYYTRKKKYN